MPAYAQDVASGRVCAPHGPGHSSLGTIPPPWRGIHNNQSVVDLEVSSPSKLGKDHRLLGVLAIPGQELADPKIGALLESSGQRPRRVDAP